MSTNSAQRELEPFDEAWRELDDLVNEIAKLSKSNVPKGEFYAKAIEAVMHGLKAAGAALWICSTAKKAQLAYQVLPPNLWPGDTQSLRPRLIELVLETGRAGILPPRCPPTVDPRAVNPTDYLLIVCPWVVEDEVSGVIEVLASREANAEVQTGYVRYLEAIGELLADHEQTGQLHNFRSRLQERRRFDQLCESLHDSVDLRTTAYTIANEGRQFLGCDRVSVLLKRDARYRLLAISGVDTFHRRARVVGMAEQLCKAVGAMDEPLWHPAPDDTLPPQIETLLSAYVDETHASSLAVLPLKVPPREGDRRADNLVGAMVIERFYGGFDDRQRESTAPLCLHSALALRNARELDDLPLSGVLRKARWLRGNRRPIKIGLVLLGLAAVLVVLIFVPADLQIAARGELQPRRMQDVFARTDGLVTEIQAQHGQHVAADQLLAVLRHPQLDLEFKQVLGELQTSRKRLSSLEAERVQTPRDTDEQRRQVSLLAAQGEELREMIRGLEAQYGILQQKQKDLEVRSPMSGEILTWNIQQLLAARPVDRGQALMTVGDLSGPWQLDLHVPDRQIAHVLAAQRTLGRTLEVSYVLGTAPAVMLRGTVREVAMRTEVPEGDVAYVQVFVDVDRTELPELVPGASVLANIACGRRSLGYVWLHDFVNAVRTALF